MNIQILRGHATSTCMVHAEDGLDSLETNSTPSTPTLHSTPRANSALHVAYTMEQLSRNIRESVPKWLINMVMPDLSHSY